MRIVIDIRPLLELNRSGVANYAVRLLQSLLARPAAPDRRYVLFCNAYGRRLPTDIPPRSRNVEHRFTRFPNRLLNLSFAGVGLPAIDDLCGGADLVYLPNLNFARARAPLAVTVHDLSFERYPDLFSAKQRLWHSLVAPRRLLSRAASVVAVSEHTRDDIIETYGVPAGKITVINPGVGPEFRPVPREEWEPVMSRYGLTPGYFLFLGTLEPRKNIPGVISAFEKLGPRERLVIAGGRGWLYQDIFHQAALSPARARIRFLDYVTESEKPALYSAATALVYPSFYEGFGIPPLEAMACGTPTVVSQATSLGEVVGSAGLLVNPHDIGEIAEAMAALLDDEPLRRTLTARGLERARLFTWDESARRLDGLFARLSGEVQAGPF